MTVAWYALWFLVAVSLLVTVHEFGHFWVARRLGFKVLRFSVGFGTPLLKRIAGPDRTEYVLAAIPLGGYVKMLDEREGPVPSADLARSFTRKPPWQRILVLLAGPGFNVLFAIVVLWGMLWVNGVNDVKPVVGQVTPDTPAALAGLRPGDRILAVNGAPTPGQTDVNLDLLDAMSASGATTLTVQGKDGERRTARLVVGNPAERRRLTEPDLMFKGLGFSFWQPSAPPVVHDVVAGGPAAAAGLKAGDEIVALDGQPVSFSTIFARIQARPDQSISVRYRRAGQTHTARLTTTSAMGDGGHTVGRIEAELSSAPVKYPPDMVLHKSLPPLAALGHASAEAWDMTALQGQLFWRMMLGHVSLKNLSGPLSIAEYAGESAEAGVAAFLGFLVLISLSLGFLNLLPIPILDGGQILFQLLEWVKGSPLSERTVAFGQQVGIALLLLLMSVAVFNDIARQFS